MYIIVGGLLIAINSIYLYIYSHTWIAFTVTANDKGMCRKMQLHFRNKRLTVDVRLPHEIRC